jgi:glutaredoxin
MNLQQVTLTLYTRFGCHLCETMEQQLSTLQSQLGFAVTIIDIDSDDTLSLRYNDKVPVLAHGEHEICHYFFNAEVVQNYLHNHQS